MLITVFTPTYNRSNLLPRLYESLCNQTFRDFEWVIVDDGSTDNTPELIQSYIREDKIFIRYFRQENMGKHVAINNGVKEAKGELFFIADSDDILPNDSLNNVSKFWHSVEDDNEIGGVCGLDQTFIGNIIGSGLPQDIIVCTTLEIRLKYKVTGDMKEVFKTDAFKKFPFPIVKGEKFCPESLVWNRFSQKYKLKFFNIPIYSVEYQSEGLSARSTILRMRNPIYAMMIYSEMLNYSIPFPQKIRSAINYYRFSFCTERNDKPIISPKWKILKPMGLLMHLKDNRVIKNY